MIRIVLLLSFIITSFISCQENQPPPKSQTYSGEPVTHLPKKDSLMEIKKTDEEWEKQLTPLQYEVTRHKGTERAFTGEYWNNHDTGMYVCVCCGQKLFG